MNKSGGKEKKRKEKKRKEKKRKEKRKRKRKRKCINNENKKARGPKFTGLNATNNHKQLISMLQGRQ
ncbi:MAG: hypothetical protein NTV50_08250 [Planctomycetota bacterium]|nr:hypothetical protein [Planctomycetota bacterium]